MTLKEIRTADKEKLKQAVKEVIGNQYKMTLGEIHATTRTILDRGLEIGISKDELNQWARGESCE